jgi:hypothetical protein
MYSNQHAAALLLAFTPDQRRAMYHLVRSSTDPEREVAAAQAAAPAAVPIFRLVDVGEIITPDAIGNWQAGMSIMFASLFTKTWSVDEVRNIIEKGARIKGDYAQQIADRVVSPDTNLTDFAYRLLSTVSELPFVPARFRAFAPAVGAAFSYLYSALGTKDFAADNSATMLRLGRELNNLAVETLLTAAEAAYESRMSPQTLDAFGSTMQNIWQWLWGQSAGNASPLGLPANAEGGDVYSPDAHGFSRMQRAARQLASAYEQGDPDAPMELGFIMDAAQGIGKGVASAGKAIAKNVRKRRSARRAKHRAPRRQDQQTVAQMRDQMAAMGLDTCNKQDLHIGLSRMMGASSVPAGPYGHNASGPGFDDNEFADEGGDPYDQGDFYEAGDVPEEGAPCEGGAPEDGDPNGETGSPDDGAPENGGPSVDG